MLTCQQLVEFLADYLCSELPWRQRLAFQLHLCVCRHCRNYLATYRQTILLARESQDPASFDERDPVPEALVRAVLAARGELR